MVALRSPKPSVKVQILVALQNSPHIFMQLIDLTLPLYDNMSVYPGDPEVKITQVHHLEKEGWNMATASFPTHIATHVNVPIHMVDGGKTLDDFGLENFMGTADLYRADMTFSADRGVIFTTQNLTPEIAQKLIATPPKFIGLSDKLEFDLELEKLTLEHNIISFENLANTDQLPSTFEFYGVPLKIRGGDGSPVRAFAMVK